ncbi:putative RNA methyltransferase [Psychrobacter sanguinis]|uniref:putative RNA methyltransferase n=1 Tax=Psychrobacter sanguinis TaxID=861445 RepID=UPI0028B15C4E|nr:methyltransferase domain-containing protein [Psychrobacter sanguinis]
MTFQSLAFDQPQFVCPYCQSPLIVGAKTWLCDGSLNNKETKHPFDVARQGYVNLLPVQNKKSKDPGDSAQSIEARHRFLSQGFYQPLQQLIAKLISAMSKASTQSNTQTWLDVGCGEGYYTGAIAEALATTETNNPCLIALDISKPAVATTARVAKQDQQLWYQLKADKSTAKNTTIYPMVASASHLPLIDRSIDGISTIFSPILPEEFARVLKSEGRLIIAKPDAGHLQSMREALFDEVRPHDSDKFLDELAPYFNQVETHQVTADLQLSAEALADLMTMTPYSYRARAEKREALLASTRQQDFQTQARFLVYELVRI